MAINALDLIDQELARASTPKPSGKKPLFLFFKDGHKAVIRPLFDLKDAVVLKKHNKYNDDPTQRVNAICASEIGKPCVYCQQAELDKKLAANQCFYLPVHVYGVVDQYAKDENGKISPAKITYKERDEDGNETIKPVQGIRLLELKAFGAEGKILKSIREFMREDGNPGITELDFTLTQVGANQKKDYVLMPKGMPKPMADQLREVLKQDAFKYENIRQRIIDAVPPVAAEPPLQGGGSQIEEDAAFDDTIVDF